MTRGRAITTHYHGYRFRSRLEARWAVFMDALGVRWEYEREGFVLPDGTSYLPDFYLVDQRWWVEIKPIEESNDPAALARLAGLAVVTNCWTALLSGTPGSLATHQAVAFFPGSQQGHGVAAGTVNWRPCPVCGRWGLVLDYYDLPCDCVRDATNQRDLPRLALAQRAAQQARFEFGERPITA